MKKASLSGREIILLALLAVIIVGVVYYMGFYTPHQSDMVSIKNQIADADRQLSSAEARLASMGKMQEELDRLHTLPEDEITEIAPYDNAKVIMNQLNGILAQSLEYQLKFADPVIGSDGLVRRSVTLTFKSENYDSAKKIIEDLSGSKWRCLISSLSMSASEDVENEEVSVSAALTFYESTKLG